MNPGKVVTKLITLNGSHRGAVVISIANGVGRLLLFVRMFGLWTDGCEACFLVVHEIFILLGAIPLCFLIKPVDSGFLAIVFVRR